MGKILRLASAALLLIAMMTSPSASFASKHRTTATAPVTAGDLQLFSSEASAQRHCPKDEVVWLNTNSGIYHEKGMRYYANSKSGAFVCRREAGAAGDRDTRNGQ